MNTIRSIAVRLAAVFSTYLLAFWLGISPGIYWGAMLLSLLLVRQYVPDKGCHCDACERRVGRRDRIRRSFGLWLQHIAFCVLDPSEYWCIEYDICGAHYALQHVGTYSTARIRATELSGKITGHFVTIVEGDEGGSMKIGVRA